MSVIVKGCGGLVYGTIALKTIKFQILGSKEEGREIIEGPLKDHVIKVGREMQINPSITLIERTAGPIFYNRVQNEANLLREFPLKPLFSSFGNTLFPVKLGIRYREQMPLDMDTTKFFLTKAIAELKTNHDLFRNIVFLVTAIASTILFSSTFPIGCWFIGYLIGAIAHKVFVSLNDRKIDALAMKHSSLAEQLAVIDFFQRVKNQATSPTTQRTLEERIHHLRGLINPQNI